MEADTAFYKGGTDIFLFGSARARGRKPVTTMRVSVRVGAFRREVVVFGDRAWLPRGNIQNLVPSEPQRFVEMPLTLQRAYGGKSEWDGLDMMWPDNPTGKGFYLEGEQALGKPLPNIEDPRFPIVRWDDRPAPVGLTVCPMAHSGRIRSGTEFAKDGALIRLDGRLFNAAFPEMVATDVKPGDAVVADGVLHEGPLQFALPPIPVTFRVTFDTTAFSEQPAIDQVGIESDKRRVFITYRHPFRYVLHARQRRQAELLPVEA
jgi:hypothetical protein